jgi:hypothetical protein
LIIVDAANVIGSRPTGWWRDRAGAAQKFVEQIRVAAAAGQLEPPVVVVLEGAARKGAEESSVDGVRVLHASGSGDDAIAALAAEAEEPVVAVTADRELRERVRRVGGRSVGPSWLYERI